MHEHALNEIITSLAVKKTDWWYSNWADLFPLVAGGGGGRWRRPDENCSPILFNLILEELLAGNLLLNII